MAFRTAWVYFDSHEIRAMCGNTVYKQTVLPIWVHLCTGRCKIVFQDALEFIVHIFKTQLFSRLHTLAFYARVTTLCYENDKETRE